MNVVELRVSFENPYPKGTPEFFEYRNARLREAGFINLPKAVVFGCYGSKGREIGTVYCTDAGREYQQLVDVNVLDPRVATLMAMRGEL